MKKVRPLVEFANFLFNLVSRIFANRCLRKPFCKLLNIVIWAQFTFRFTLAQFANLPDSIKKTLRKFHRHKIQMYVEFSRETFSLLASVKKKSIFLSKIFFFKNQKQTEAAETWRGQFSFGCCCCFSPALSWICFDKDKTSNCKKF